MIGRNVTKPTQDAGVVDSYPAGFVLIEEEVRVE